MSNFPSKADYVTAIRNFHVCFKESSLKNGKYLANGTRITMYSGGYSIVFPFITNNNKKVAIRCWFADVGNAKIRTETIAKYLKKIKSPYFVDFEFKSDAIVATGTAQPVVVMDWVEGKMLKDYIDLNINNKSKLELLADNFLEMVKNLHQNNIAHGDLQHGNIIITKNDHLMLVDYDSMFVPELSNMRDEIKGLPGYQHPKRKNVRFINAKLDYFSELVIYLSILVFAEYPNYWNDYKDTEDLLFSKDDFESPETSNLFNSLRQSNNLKIKKLISLLISELKKDKFDDLTPLEDLLTSNSISFTSTIINENTKTAHLKKITEKFSAQTTKSQPVTTKPDADEIIEAFSKPNNKSAPILTKPDTNKIIRKFSD